MNGYDIYESSLKLLGYNDAYGASSENPLVKERAITAINSIGGDLFGMPPIKSLLNDIEVPEKYNDAFIYGVCMLLSLSNGDSERNRVFSDIYNQKRTLCKAANGKISDMIPSVSEV